MSAISLPKLFSFGFLVLCAGLGISLVLTRFLISALPRFGMVDIPRGRHQHSKPVPRGGGLAMIVSFTVVCLLYLVLADRIPEGGWNFPFIRQLLLPIAAITVLGVLDDRFELGSKTKLAVHLLIGGWFFFTGASINTILGVTMPWYIDLPLTLCWTFGTINAFNLIDGMDGVAAGLAAISALSLGVWQILSNGVCDSVFYMLALCGAALGFLRYNFAPARIFMGDTGSMFLGMLFAYFSMGEASGAATVTSLLVPVLAMGVPVFDVALAILRRAFRRYILKDKSVSIMSGDHDHLHHRLQGMLRNQKKTALSIYMLALLLAAGAMAAAMLNSTMRAISFVLLLGLVFMMVRLATVELYDAASLLSEGLKVPRRSFLLTVIHPVLDLFLLICAYTFSLVLHYSPLPHTGFILRHAVSCIAPFVVVLGLSNIYSTYWLRAGLYRYYKLMLLLLLSCFLEILVRIVMVFVSEGVPADYITSFVNFQFTYLLFGCNLIVLERFLLHYFESYNFRKLQIMLSDSKTPLPRVLIYGGGVRCRLFLNSFNCAHRQEFPRRRLIGIMDDNPALRGLNVYGKQVFGSADHLERILEKHPFEEILVTLDDLEPDKLARIRSFAKENNIKVKYFRCVISEEYVPAPVINPAGSKGVPSAQDSAK